MRFDVTILGCAGATPTIDRLPTCQVVNVNERNYMIDCGEGAQISILKNGIKKSRIDVIFISHLHGDHFFGLIGLLSSMHLESRKEHLTLVCPQYLKHIIEVQTIATNFVFCFELIYVFTNSERAELIYENKDIEVTSFPLLHRIPTTGFVIREQSKLRKIDVEKAVEYEIPIYFYNQLKAGENYTNKTGLVVDNQLVTVAGSEARSYAYCSDTKYDESYINSVANVTLLYHEATFTQTHAARAVETLHSTALQAATVAAKATAKQLLIGHYSAKYKTLDEHLAEAKSVFENTILSYDGLVISL